MQLRRMSILGRANTGTLIMFARRDGAHVVTMAATPVDPITGILEAFKSHHVVASAMAAMAANKPMHTGSL
jgi:hypothetical protein